MKTSTLVISLAMLGAAGAADVAVDSQPTENLKDGSCVSNFDAADGYDFFPDKFVTTESDLFTVTYHNTYKVVEQTHSSFKAVLYQCGTPKPTVGELTYTPDLFVKVPITKAAFTSSSYIAMVELLGERETLKLFANQYGSITSPCLNKMIDDGVATGSGDDADATIKAALVDGEEDAVTFAGQGATNYRAYKLAVTEEDEILEGAEYVGMIAAVYNQEAKANEIFTSIKDRYNCVKNNVELLKEAAATSDVTDLAKMTGMSDEDYEVLDGETPKVLWFGYANDGSNEGWSVASCPNYYCEVIGHAGGDTINYAGVSTGSGIYNYLSDDELLSNAAAVDADYAIISGYPWQSGGYDGAKFQNKMSFLNQIKAFKESTTEHPRVFDTDGMVFNSNSDWFESRFAEPDVLLEDVVTAIWPSTWSSATMAAHTPVWIKPVETAARSRGTCTDVSEPLELQADACTGLTLGTAVGILVDAVDSAAAARGPSTIAAAVALAALGAWLAM